MKDNTTDQVWPYDPNIVIKVNPAKQKKLATGLIWIAGIAAAYFVLTSVALPIVEEHARKSKIAQMEPLMRQLGAAGKPSAIVWLAQKFPDESIAPLQKLADTGNGEALFTLAWIKHRSDPEARDAMIKRSADAGFPPAIAYQLRKSEG